MQPDSWDKEAAISRLKEQFKIKGKLLEKFEHPYLYLSKDVINNKKINLQALEISVAKELSKFPGISLAVSSAALQQSNLPDTPLYRSVLNNFNPKRSGNIYVVPEPNWFVNEFDGLAVASTHGSPWNYDTYVPIVFAGAGLNAKMVTRKVYTVDVAPSLSAYVGAKQPSGAAGEILTELFDF